jgi:fibronectin type 3 domain-containing protein
MNTTMETTRNTISFWLLLCLPFVSANAGSYNWQEVSYSWWDNTFYGTPVSGLGDDNNFGPFDLGFSFPFYDQYFSQVRLSENGWMSFTSTSSQYSNLGLPDTSMPENLVAPFFDDLDFRGQGSVYVSSEGNAFVVTWVNAQHFSYSGGPFTFQAILYDNGDILFQYQDVATLGDNVTVGVQDSTQTDGLQVFHGSTDGTGAPTAGRAFRISANTLLPPLQTPTSVSASDGTYTDKVYVTWSASPGATSYQVCRCTGSMSADTNQIGIAYGTTFNDTTAVPGTTYYYLVKAVNASQTSGFSSSDSGYRRPALLAPTGIAASDGTYSDKVRVTWNAVSGASSYEVWRSTGSSSASASLVGVTTSTTYNDTTAVADTIYYYWTKALNSAGSSLFSSSNTGYRASGPAAPTGATATDGDYADKVRITWNPVSGATSYEVWRNTSSSTSSANKIGTTTVTSYNDATAVAGLAYYYWVKTVTSRGTSGFSSPDTGFRLAPPVAPIGVTASDGTYTDKVRVTWTAVAAATSYEVWRNNANSASTASRVATSSSFSCDDTTAVPGSTYYYWVKAKNAAGTSGFSGGDTGHRLGPLPGPTGVAATDGTYADKVQVSWSVVPGASGYEIWRNTVNNWGSASRLANTAGTLYNDLSAVAGTTYYFWVKTINAAGAGGFSASDRGYRLARPAVPNSVVATDGTYADKVRVTWNIVNGATGYEVWRNTANALSTAAKMGTASGGQYDDTTAVPGTTYYYWIKASNAAGPGGAGGPDTGYRLAPPAPPTTVTASEGTYADKVQVTWSRVNGASSYEVWRNTANNASTATKIGSPNSSPYNDPSAVAGTTYYYWVRAVNVAGAGAFSSADSGYRLAPPTAPGGVTATDGTYTDKVQVSWSGVTGATSYEVWRNTANNSSTAGKAGSSTASPYNDTTAGVGTTYYYWVKAVNTAGPSAFGGPDGGYRVAVPAPPTGVTASDGTYTDRVRVSWNSVNSSTGYELWRNTASSTSGASKIASPTASPCDDTTALGGMTYYYWVKTKNSATTSAFSTSDTGYRPDDVNLNVSALGVSATAVEPGQSVIVSWGIGKSGSSPANSFVYEVYWSSDPQITRSDTRLGQYGPTSLPAGAGSVSGDLAVNIPTTAVRGSTYYIGFLVDAYDRVREYNEADNTSSVAVAIKLAPPTSIAATDGTYPDKVRVSWGAVSGATSYELWRSAANNSSRASHIDTATASPYDDTSAVSGTTYYYWLKAVNTAGPSAFSTSDAGYRLAPPAAPTGVTATYGTYADKVQVNWNPVSGATSYEVWRHTANDSTAATIIASPATRPWNDTSAVPGTSYYYWVKAVNAAGAGAPGGPDAGYRLAAPTPPTGVAATDGTYTDKVQVSWNSVSGATSYEVWRNTADNSSTASKIGSPIASPYNDTSATANKRYYYWVKAANAAGPGGFSASDPGFKGSLVAFDLEVSIDPSGTFPSSDYLTHLHAGMQRAANLLSQLTSGQMTIRSVKVYRDGANWHTVDLQIANTPHWPENRADWDLAFPPVMGVVTFGTYNGKVGIPNDSGGWDAYDWDEPSAYRCLLHELGHFYMKLYDEYKHFSFPGANWTFVDDGECTDSSYKCLMDYEFGPMNICVETNHDADHDTAQQQVHGHSCWWTIHKKFPLVIAPTTTPTALNPDNDPGADETPGSSMGWTVVPALP